MKRVRRLSEAAGVALSQESETVLDGYFRLLQAWNARTNLTALDLDSPEDRELDRLLIEPMAASEHLPAGTKWVIERLEFRNCHSIGAKVPPRLGCPSIWE